MGLWDFRQNNHMAPEALKTVNCLNKASLFILIPSFRWWRRNSSPWDIYRGWHNLFEILLCDIMKSKHFDRMTAFLSPFMKYSPRRRIEIEKIIFAFVTFQRHCHRILRLATKPSPPRVKVNFSRLNDVYVLQPFATLRPTNKWFHRWEYIVALKVMKSVKSSRT